MLRLVTGQDQRRQPDKAARQPVPCKGCGEDFLVPFDEPHTQVCEGCKAALVEERKRLTENRRRAWARQQIAQEQGS